MEERNEENGLHHETISINTYDFQTLTYPRLSLPFFLSGKSLNNYVLKGESIDQLKRQGFAPAYGTFWTFCRDDGWGRKSLGHDCIVHGDYALEST